MEQEAVRRKQWLTHAAFLDLLGATNLIPGPGSTQMAMAIGYRRAGWAGLASLALTWQGSGPRHPVAGALAIMGLGPASLPMVGLAALFMFFLKLGAVLFGSGYVLLAFLQADLVERLHWLTQAQLLDAVAAGQITPGPVFTTATFIGYFVRGLPGALVATCGIFLPSFLFVGILGVVLPRLRRSPATAGFLDGINVGALAVMAAVTWFLSRAALVDVPTLLLGLVSVVLLIRFRPNPSWLILGGGVAGLLLR